MVEPRTSRLTRLVAIVIPIAIPIAIPIMIAITIASAAIATPRAAAQTDDEAVLPSAEPVPGADPALPWFVGGGIGVGARLDGFVPAAFRLVEEVGFHFDAAPVGPYLALMLAQDIASHVSLQFGVRAGWDLELLRRPDFSIVVSPSLGVAFALDAATPTGEWAYFLVQPALGAGVLLLERVLAIWVRPIGVDVYVGEQVHGGWAAVLGASVAL